MAFPEDLQWNQPGVEPTQDKKNEGWTPEEKPPAEYFNWFFNRTCRAVNYLKTKSDESSSKFDIDGHDHDGTVGNGPKLTANNIVNTLISGLDTTDVQSTLEAIFSESKKKSGSVRNVVVNGPVSTSGMANVLRDRYNDNLCVDGTPISGGDLAGYPKEGAFDLSVLGTYWASSQTGTTVNGAAYIGYDSGVSSPKDVRKIMFRQSVTSSANNVSSVLAQWSDNGTTWTTAATATVVPGYNTLYVPSVGAKRFWRLLANSAVTAGYSWVCHDLLMYEIAVTGLTDSDITVQAGALVAFAAGFDLVNKQPVDYWELTQQMSLTLTAADGYTVPSSYTDDLCNGGTAISGGDNASYPKANAFDNIINSTTGYWQSLQTSGHLGVSWIGYDLGVGVTKAIRKMVYWLPGGAGNVMPSVKAQYSDNGTTWVDAATTNNVVNSGGVIYIPYAGAHRYWRLLANASLSAGWIVHELEMMEALQTHYVYLTRDANGNVTVGSTRNKPRTVKSSDTTADIYSDNLCIGGGFSATSTFNTYGPHYAFDGNATTWWESNNPGGNGDAIACDLGVARHIRRLVLDQSADGTGLHYMSSVKIQRCTDGVNWIDVLTANNLIGGKNIIDLPASLPSRFWRVLANIQTSGGATYLWCVTEITMHEISNDINLYDPIAGVTKHYDGSTWDNVARVFVGEAVTDSTGNVVSYTTYDYNKTKLKALPAEDTDDVITLGQITASLLANGWVKLPVMFNGVKIELILQWVNVPVTIATANTDSGTYTASFPIGFPTACLGSVGSISYIPSLHVYSQRVISGKTTASAGCFSTVAQTVQFTVFALGY